MKLHARALTPAARTLCERISSVSSLLTTLPLPSVHGPPTNSMMRAAQLPGGTEAPISAVATWWGGVRGRRDDLSVTS